MNSKNITNDTRNYDTIPIGPLGIIAMPSIAPLGQRIDSYIANWRKGRETEHTSTLPFNGYIKESYLVDAKIPRFGSGEAKGIINHSVRGADLFFLTDVTNHSLTYSLFGKQNRMSPDDHFQDLKRGIAAVGGKARRINVIMPYLYESRQHKRMTRESLDCALALQELVDMGVENIITFDAHDPRVQNAIPLKGFETVTPAYQYIKTLLRNVDDVHMDSKHMMIISPDEGGTSRAVYYSNVLGLDLGMFYKRRDYTRIVNGRNPIVAHEFLGSSVEGKDCLVIDDMISSGESMFDVAKELKSRKAKRVFLASSFGLFTNGLSKFDDFYEKGLIDKVLTTNLIYQTPELLEKPYYLNVDMGKYIALIIDTLNHDSSISDLLNPVQRIRDTLHEYKQR